MIVQRSNSLRGKRFEGVVAFVACGVSVAVLASCKSNPQSSSSTGERVSYGLASSPNPSAQRVDGPDTRPRFDSPGSAKHDVELQLNLVDGSNDPTTSGRVEVTLDVVNLGVPITEAQVMIEHDNIGIRLVEVRPAKGWSGKHTSAELSNGQMFWRGQRTSGPMSRDGRLATFVYSTTPEATGSIRFSDDYPGVNMLIPFTPTGSLPIPVFPEPVDLLCPWPSNSELGILVKLEIQALRATSVTREVTFVTSTCSGDPTTQTRYVDFVPDPDLPSRFGFGHVLLRGVDPDTRWISVREGHTLRKLARVNTKPKNRCMAKVNFTGDANRLISGDFQTITVQQDNAVDVVDFSILASRWNTTIDPNDSMGADATGDGVQDTADFTVVQINYFQRGDEVGGCSGLRRTPNLPRTSISVAEAKKRIPNAAKADLTGDGVIDVKDIRAFAKRENLRLPRDFEQRVKRLERQRAGE